jgi:hypothetical protein
MPAPQATQMQMLAKTQFASFAIKIATDWKQPQGNPKADQYSKAFKPSEKVGMPIADAPALFQPASMNKYHCDQAKTNHDNFKAYIDGICSAICSAWSQWQSMATIAGIIVNGPTAAGGQVAGPPWTPLILASAPKSKPSEAKYSQTIATVIGTAWLQYTATIKVPGLPWYPAFTMFPSPVTPPTPNVPAPLMSLTQVPVSVSKAVLKQQMIGQHGDPQAMHSEKLFDAIADAFDKTFKIWQGATILNNVMGFGPVPTFAPPFVPAGPVVGGTATMTPGGFT